MDIQRYNKIKKSSTHSTYKISTDIPKPTDRDYTIGFVRRYFIQKVNDKGAPIFELNGTNYDYALDDPIYTGVIIKWRISGPLETKYNDVGIVIDKSVSDSNRIAIQLKSNIIPNLKLYLPNLLQFYKK
jgi:hypothetical protein|tara:strand:- start:88 stop:474 length:387 start_codon:yes stop_codon:yes gene_type:complete